MNVVVIAADVCPIQVGAVLLLQMVRRLEMRFFTALSSFGTSDLPMARHIAFGPCLFDRSFSPGYLGGRMTQGRKNNHVQGSLNSRRRNSYYGKHKRGIPHQSLLLKRRGVLKQIGIVCEETSLKVKPLVEQKTKW